MSVIKDFYKTVPIQLKSSVVLFIASFVNSAINLVTIPIFTRIMTIEEYGVTAQYNSWLNIITVFATLSLSAGVFQVAMNEYQNDRDKFTFSAMILSNVCTCLVFAIIFSSVDYFSNLFHLDRKLLYLMFGYLLFYPAMSMWLSRYRYEYQYMKVALLSISSALFSQVLALLLVLFVKNQNLGIVKVFATQGSMILFSMYIYLSIAKKAKWKPNFDYIKFALTFNLPLLAHYLAQYALRSTDKIMITNFIGEGATGIYSLATTVANISMLAWTAMSASLTPYVYSHVKNKDYKSVNRIVIMVEILFAVCCIIVALIGPEIIVFLGSQKYMSGVLLIPPIAASSLLTAVYSFYSSIAFYYHKTVSTALMTIIAALINVALNYISIPKFGIVAAAYTTEIAYLVYTILHFINYRKIVKHDKIYNDNSIIGIAFITTILCIGSSVLYEFNNIRYCIILFLLIIAFLRRKKLKNLFILINKQKG